MGKGVSDADLMQVLEASIRAATASARQSYSIVVVRDSARIHRLVQYQAPVLLVYCLDYCRIVDLAHHLGADFPADSMMMFLAGVADTLLAAQTAAIAARSLEIDSLFTNAIHRVPLQSVYDELKLPERHCFPLIALLLGYADNLDQSHSGRLSGPGVVHYEQYSRLSPLECNELVAAYDDPASNLGLTDAWRAEGFEHYLEWFYARRARRVPLAKDAELSERLARAGFIPKLQRLGTEC